jgi:hypothetical protein
LNSGRRLVHNVGMSATESKSLRPSLGKVLALMLLIGVGLIALSSPIINRTRREIRRQACVEELMHIVAAKAYYSVDKDLKDGTPVTLDELIAHGKVIQKPPVLPEGATDLEINPIGTQPSCVFEGKKIQPITKSSKPASAQA